MNKFMYIDYGVIFRVDEQEKESHVRVAQKTPLLGGVKVIRQSIIWTLPIIGKIGQKVKITHIAEVLADEQKKEDAEHYFSELKESEDERIRKELIEAFEVYDIESSWNLIPVKHILDWLERQKEKKSAQSVDGHEMLFASCDERPDGIDGKVETLGDGVFSIIVDPSGLNRYIEKNFKAGDKVKIIIVKEDEK